VIQPWPHLQKQMIDKSAEKEMQIIIDIITAIRSLRSEVRIAEGQKVRVIIVADAKTTDLIKANQNHIINLAKLEELDLPGLKSEDSSRAEKTQCHSSHGLKARRFPCLPAGRCEGLKYESSPPKLKGSISAVIAKAQIFLQLEGLVDIAKELDRINKEMDRLNSSLKGKELRLKNKEFLKKAPAEVIEKEKIAIDEIKKNLMSFKRIADELRK